MKTFYFFKFNNVILPQLCRVPCWLLSYKTPWLWNALWREMTLGTTHAPIKQSSRSTIDQVMLIIILVYSYVGHYKVLTNNRFGRINKDFSFSNRIHPIFVIHISKSFIGKFLLNKLFYDYVRKTSYRTAIIINRDNKRENNNRLTWYVFHGLSSAGITI